MPVTVLTGGQSGVDEGALRGVNDYTALERPIGQKLTVDWMAWLPKGYKREERMPPFMLKQKGKRVGELLLTDSYSERTKHNIVMSDALLVIEGPGSTPGTRLTQTLAKKARMQVWRFQNADNRAVHRAESHAVAYWLRSMESWMGLGSAPITLMVAGPRASKWPEGEEAAASILRYVVEAYERDVHVKPNRNDR